MAIRLDGIALAVYNKERKHTELISLSYYSANIKICIDRGERYVQFL